MPGNYRAAGVATGEYGTTIGGIGIPGEDEVVGRSGGEREGTHVGAGTGSPVVTSGLCGGVDVGGEAGELGDDEMGQRLRRVDDDGHRVGNRSGNEDSD